MESRKHLAAEKKRCNSHNCAQAVVCTYCDLVGLPEQTALDIAGAYGTGMGNMEGTCGALVGAGMILGLHTKDRNLSRARMKNLMEKFSSGTEPPGRLTALRRRGEIVRKKRGIPLSFFSFTAYWRYLAACSAMRAASSK